MLMPVVLPPGRASETTNPAPTMSSDSATCGKVRVAAWTARVAKRPPLTIASGAPF
jgi:hypothetical protein